MIYKVTNSDIHTVLKIAKSCTEHMIDNSAPQWNDY
jgi:hypothetical protein